MMVSPSYLLTKITHLGQLLNYRFLLIICGVLVKHLELYSKSHQPCLHFYLLLNQLSSIISRFQVDCNLSLRFPTLLCFWESILRFLNLFYLYVIIYGKGYSYIRMVFGFSRNDHLEVLHRFIAYQLSGRILFHSLRRNAFPMVSHRSCEGEIINDYLFPDKLCT